jgi:nucleotide-binding universal stress UspA family protein
VAVMSRVIVGVSGSPGCLPALRYAAEVARIHQAPLIPVIAWLPPGGEMADRTTQSPALRQIWAEAAGQRLQAALQAAFGGPLADVETQPQIIRGEPGRSLIRVATAETDLLVIGTGRRGWAGRLWLAGVGRYCLAHAQCPVLAIPPSPLDRELSKLGRRGWAFRRRPLSPADIPSPTSR